MQMGIFERQKEIQRSHALEFQKEKELQTMQKLQFEKEKQELLNQLKTTTSAVEKSKNSTISITTFRNLLS